MVEAAKRIQSGAVDKPCVGRPARTTLGLRRHRSSLRAKSHRIPPGRCLLGIALPCRTLRRSSQPQILSLFGPDNNAQTTPRGWESRTGYRYRQDILRTPWGLASQCRKMEFRVIRCLLDTCPTCVRGPGMTVEVPRKGGCSMT